MRRCGWCAPPLPLVKDQASVPLLSGGGGRGAAVRGSRSLGSDGRCGAAGWRRFGSVRFGSVRVSGAEVNIHLL